MATIGNDVKARWIMAKFIYAFSADTAEAMLRCGLHLIKSDIANNMYVFENNPDVEIPYSKRDFVFADTLTF